MADQNQNEQQQSAEQHTGEQAPEQTDQVKEDIQKAVSKNFGGKRERASKRLNNSQKAQRVNPRFYSPIRQKSDRIR